MVETPETVASKQNRYLRLMQQAQQLDDPLLVRLIQQKLALYSRTGYRPAADRRVIIPFPSMQASAETCDHEPFMFKSSDFNLKKGRGKMDKKFLRAYLCITLILLLGEIVFGALYYNPDNFVFPDGHNFHRTRSQNPYEEYHLDFFRTEHSPQNETNAPVLKLIVGIYTFLLIGYLFVIFYQKYKMDSKADSVDSGNALHKIALESGRTEYELFVIAAEEWSITEAKIDEDFKNYMAANILPYYVMDLVRKNNERVNKSLEKEGEIEPTSWWDLVKALLLFPGCFFLLIFLVTFFHPDSIIY